MIQHTILYDNWIEYGILQYSPAWNWRVYPLEILVNLQTFELNRCIIRCLPSTIRKLHQLRHLYGSWSRLRLSQYMMDLCGWLTNLQTLAFWVDDSGRLEDNCLERLAQLITLSIRGRSIFYLFLFFVKIKNKKLSILFSFKNIPIF